MMNNSEALYGWVFAKNPYTDTWLATTREFYNELWSGAEGNVISSRSPLTLEKLIMKYDGDLNKIKEAYNM